MPPRIAVLSDALGIARVQVAAWQVAYRGLMDQPLLGSLEPAAKLQSWEAFLAAPDHQLFVVEDGSHIAGYAHVCASRDEPNSFAGEVASMYVAPAYWRRGLGTVLLHTAERALTMRGHNSITLWVLEANKSARQFYEHFGYSSDGASKQHPKSGLIEVRYQRTVHAAA